MINFKQFSLENDKTSRLEYEMTMERKKVLIREYKKDKMEDVNQYRNEIREKLDRVIKELELLIKEDERRRREAKAS